VVEGKVQVAVGTAKRYWGSKVNAVGSIDKCGALEGRDEEGSGGKGVERDVVEGAVQVVVGTAKQYWGSNGNAVGSIDNCGAQEGRDEEGSDEELSGTW